jgi:hypothetical protein
MEIKEIIPANGTHTAIYCEKCRTHTELTYVDFSQTVAGIHISIAGLPTLRCPACGHEQLTDGARRSILQLHEDAIRHSVSSKTATRTKWEQDFGFTKVRFLYAADDYFCFPGLERPHNLGFLQPVFFKRQVLFKYDNAPGYRLTFSSTTYGTIQTEENSISFGINRHGNVVMWLGDIATLPENEQYYLRSENIPSDHALGSEFYDGQIEIVFTPKTKENELFALRSDFLEKCFKRFGLALGHLESEAFDLAYDFNPPVIDTPKERRHVADMLNKVYLESLNNGALDKVVKQLGAKSPGSGSLKRLQTILETINPNDDVKSLLSPLYVLYDLRVVYSHLTGETSSTQLEAVTSRLGLLPDASLSDIYAKLIAGLINTYIGMAKLVEADPAA